MEYESFLIPCDLTGRESSYDVAAITIEMIETTSLRACEKLFQIQKIQ
jgi:hypothetical protein